jgi:hypothetical protein
MTSTCQFIANATRGLSSRKQRCAKAAKSQPQLGVLLALGQRLAVNRSGYGHRSRLVQRVVQQRRQVFAPGGRPRGLPDWPFLKPAPRGGLP